MRDTLRVQGPPQSSPPEEVRSELVRLRRERDEAVKRYKAALFVAEALACLGLATLFWWAVAQ